jgi:phosphonatase-like hydrolase
MSKILLAVFDIAGTTVRDQGDVAGAFQKVLKNAGYAISTDQARRVMGYKKSDAIRILLRQQGLALPDQDLVDQMLESFNERMIRFYETASDLEPFEGTEELFRRLRGRGIRIALNTGFSSAITRTILERLQWKTGGLIDAVISSDEVQNGRPAPDMILEIMKRLRITDPLAVLKVGDTGSDIEEGRQAGCGTVVAVTTGAYSRKQLEAFRPDYIIDQLHTLEVILNNAA